MVIWIRNTKTFKRNIWKFGRYRKKKDNNSREEFNSQYIRRGKNILLFFILWRRGKKESKSCFVSTRLGFSIWFSLIFSYTKHHSDTTPDPHFHPSPQTSLLPRVLAPSQTLLHRYSISFFSLFRLVFSHFLRLQASIVVAAGRLLSSSWASRHF